MRLKRMVRGIAAVIPQGHAGPLGTGHDEVLRKASIEQKTARFYGKVRVRVDVVRECPDLTVGDEGIRGRRSPECLRRGQGCTINNANSGKVDAIEDLIHQWTFPTGTHSIEGIQQSVGLDIDVIELV